MSKRTWGAYCEELNYTTKPNILHNHSEICAQDVTIDRVHGDSKVIRSSYDSRPAQPHVMSIGHIVTSSAEATLLTQTPSQCTATIVCQCPRTCGQPEYNGCAPEFTAISPIEELHEIVTDSISKNTYSSSDVNDSSSRAFPPRGINSYHDDQFSPSAWPGSLGFVMETGHHIPTVSDLNNDQHKAQSSSHAGESILTQVQEEEVCFGSLLNVNVRILLNLADFQRVFVTEKVESERFLLFLVKHQQDAFVVCSENDTKIALLNSSISVGLRKLHELSLLRLEAVIDKTQFTMQDRKNGAKLALFHIEVNVYGSFAESERAARILSSCDMFLQDPLHFDQSLHYQNPQCLFFPEQNILDDLYAAEFLNLNDEGISQQNPTDAYGIDNLLNQECLKEHEIDARVITSLKSHQRLAVDFIFRRESGDLPLPLALWTPQPNDNGFISFHNSITGEWSDERPDEIPGGILADDMGLGKTLTMLAVVAGTLPLAEEEAKNALNTPESKLGTRTTLVVAPNSLILDSWMEEIQTHLPTDVLKVHKYHGQYKHIDHIKLQKLDVVLTTYATVETDRRKCQGFFANIHWFRIILDEAHTIRDESTPQFKAIHALSAERRWCLTGTPIQNSLKDLGAIVSFLRVFGDDAHFRDHIMKPTKSSEPSSTRSFANLHTLLGSICLRRTKDLLDIPSPNDLTHELTFSADEKDLSDQVVVRHRRLLDNAVAQDKVNISKNAILETILRLRILCNTGTHPEEQGKTCMDSKPDLEEIFSQLQQKQTAHCVCCSGENFTDGSRNDVSSRHFIRCAHLLCEPCFRQYTKEAKESQKSKHTSCSLCQRSNAASGISRSSTKSQFSLRSGACSELSAIPRISTKLNALVQDIKGCPEGSKSLVFSSWKNTLKLATNLLKDCALNIYQINGDISLAERRKALDRFENDSTTAVLLMTLSTGGEGLNITAANRIYMLEPQWNPAVEKQAISRCLRLGQKERVTIIRYIMKDSIEPEIVKCYQNRKILLAGKALQSQDWGLYDEELARIKDFLEQKFAQLASLSE